MNFSRQQNRKKSNFWCGGRSKRELFHLEHFLSLEREYPNFKFHVVLSEPLEEDNWKVKNN